MYGPQFDYDPQSDEAVAAALSPAPASAMARGSAFPGSDYGEASVPTEADYAAAAERQAWGTAGSAQQFADQARASQAAIARRAAAALDPAARADAAASAYAADANALSAAANAYAPGRTVARPTYQATKNYTTAQAGNVAAEQSYAHQVSSETLAENAAATDLMERMAQRQHDLNVDMQASAFARAEKIRAAREKVDGVNSEIARLSSDFMKSADVDPGRFWASRTAFQKFAAVMSSAMLGFARMDPFSHLQAAVREDIDAQRSNIAARRERLGAMENVASRQRAVLHDLRATLGDEQIAENALYISRMEQFKAEMTAKLMAAGQGRLTAEQNLLLSKVDQDIAKKRHEIDIIAVRNTPTTYVGPRMVLPAEVRKDYRAQASDLRKASVAATQAGIGVASDREKLASAETVAGAKLAADAAQQREQAQQQKEHGPHGVQAQLEKFAEKTGPAFKVIALIDELRAKHPGGEFPGFSKMAYGGQYNSAAADVLHGNKAGESASVHAAIRALSEELGRTQSQGAITTDELANFREMIFADVDSPFVGGSEALSKNLEALRTAMLAKIQPYEKSLSDEARMRFFRNNNVAGFEPSYGSSAIGSTDPAAAREDK